MTNSRSAKSKRIYKVFILFVLIVFFVGTLGLLSYRQPVPPITPVINPISITKFPYSVSFPHYGEASVGAINYGILATNGAQTPRPTASVAKIITALTVLNKYPLTLGQQGPILTLDANDIASYNMYAAENGSVAQVTLGEQISEYQILQALLLPSANNFADTLARWAYGSLPTYASVANQYLKSLGINHTVVGADASGFLPSTTSTSDDLVSLGLLVMKNPVLKEIVAQKTANIPVAGDIKNVNWLLGQNNIIGIKTGNTNEAGGVYLFAAPFTLGNSTITVVSSIMGADSLETALNDATPLLKSSISDFHIMNVVHTGQILGIYYPAWQDSLVAKVSSDISLPIWGNPNINPQISLESISYPLSSGSQVGNVSLTYNGKKYSSHLIVSKNLARPPFKWLLLRGRLKKIGISSVGHIIYDYLYSPKDLK